MKKGSYYEKNMVPEANNHGQEGIRNNNKMTFNEKQASPKSKEKEKGKGSKRHKGSKPQDV